MTAKPIRPVRRTEIEPIVIASDNSFAHAYGSVAEMLSEKDIGAKAQGGLEFFDKAGRRLAPVLSHAWELEGLVPTLEDPDPELVQGRLQAVVQHVGDYIRRHPETVADSGLTVDEAIAALPQLGGGTLAEDAAHFPGGDSPSGGVRLMTQGGWFHNSLHAAGWTH
ncbi:MULTISPECIES: hypothetical protein [unclassified Plantactinospora]|uniref:hypothetical protein n=1 Tax=unclassified Plantactinospora TaxID=2631981 RepID=UPI000D15B81F|nr:MULTISPECIES: hypothetical protein [unclassified Plantactinospora]AVT32776.1 hypothetical protein C6361_28655 [Plantactinospora sp. BC1]AVT37989.1 hypothetical protein C6W10_17810 [Plantactinospora sp. BB1]